MFLGIGNEKKQQLKPFNHQEGEKKEMKKERKKEREKVKKVNNHILFLKRQVWPVLYVEWATPTNEAYNKWTKLIEHQVKM